MRNLRPPGSRTRAIPRGYGFGLVSFPNYFFESVAWAALAYMSGSWAGTSQQPLICWGQSVDYVVIHSVAVLGGVDGTNDELGCQKTSRIQKGVWKGLPSPEESHGSIYILNELCDFIHFVTYSLRNLSIGQAWVEGARDSNTIMWYCLGP